MSLVASFFLAASLGLPRPQVGRVFPTIDAIVANSDSVHIGQIQRLEFSEAGDGFKTIDVRVKVRFVESLKGPKGEGIEFEFPTRYPAHILQPILKEKTEFLFVSPPRNESLRHNIAKKMVGVGQETRLSFLWFRIYQLDAMEHYVDFDSKLFTTDLRVISEMPDLLQEAREAAKRYPVTADVTGFALPRSVIEMCGYPNAYGYFVAPRGADLEALARKLRDDPAKLIAEARRKSKRVYKEPKPTPGDLQELKELGTRLLTEPPQPFAVQTDPKNRSTCQDST